MNGNGPDGRAFALQCRNLPAFGALSRLTATTKAIAERRPAQPRALRFRSPPRKVASLEAFRKTVPRVNTSTAKARIHGVCKVLCPTPIAAGSIRTLGRFRTCGSCRSGDRPALLTSRVRALAPCRNAARQRWPPDRPRPASGPLLAPSRAGASRPSALAAGIGDPRHRVLRQIPSERAVRGMFQLVHRVVTPCVWAEGTVVPYLSDSEPEGIHVRH